MNPHDDDFARVLRARADAEAPAMSVDLATVVRAGRRRRLVRGGAVLAMTAIAVTGAWSGVQALDAAPQDLQPAGTPSPAPTPAEADLHAQVDPVAGTITFPLARYDLTAEEWSTTFLARSWEMKRCAEAEVGKPLRWETAVPGDPHSDRTFGVWDLAEAEEYGYAVPPQGGRSAGAVAPDVPSAVWDGCNASPAVQAMSPEVDGSYELAAALRDASDAAAASEASRAAVADWTACLAEHDLEPAGGDSGYAVAGASTSRWDRDSVAMAVADVRCKTAVDFVPRMADARAAAQAPVLAVFRDELEARLAHQRAAVAAAEVYLAEHPEIP
ncbi:hypothetical protein [Cellulomonas pakistanensis]|uniref:Uncharacterized protein n=1 Tax=Cellulomonas pakistanensis TaxID=992287 RepID=A0A919P873_9CELL|nr:hypothetical protein [Cellulomonas pakistanensis]GIG34908.1 hypothetical protein Cpa01nite_02890 [Cellulomonas pakistanensis]